MTMRQPDVRWEFVIDAIRLFERQQQFRVDQEKVAGYFLEILAKPEEFREGLVASKFKSSDVQDAIHRSLVAARGNAISRGLDSVDYTAAVSGVHEVIDVEMACPWPFVIC